VVDHLIGRKLDEPIDPALGLQDFEIPYAAMTAVREMPPAAGRIADPSVEIVSFPAKSDGKAYRVEEVRAIEAEALAERVLALRKNGVAWRDMAVLLTGWGAADTYEAALRARGVPTYTLRDEGFYSRLEITDVVVALDTIRQPLNDRVLFGFLRSPFVGLADESLLAIARAVSSPAWPSLRDVQLSDTRDRELLSRGIALLDRLSRLRDRVSTAELIDTLITESGYLAHLALLGADGHQRMANLRKLVRLARGMAESTAAAFLDMIARSREVEAREGEARLFGESEDVVTITSVHSAKGPEWKVVFWCDMVRSPRHVTEEVMVGRDRILLKLLEDDVDDGSRGLLKDAICAEEEAETKRLWYVAATRAKDLLVLSGVPLGTGVSKGSPANEVRVRFADALAGDSVPYVAASGASYTARVRQAVVPASIEEQTAPVVSPIESVAILAGQREPVTVAAGRTRHSATELLTISRCGRRHYLRYTVGLREPPLRRRGDAERSAVRRGLVIHDVLENYAEDVALGVLVEAAIGRWDPDAPPPDAKVGAAYRRRVTTNVETVLASEPYRAVFDDPQSMRELRFAYVRDAGEHLEGSIDLIAPREDGYAIVDVKTSEVDSDAALAKAELYAPQRAVYSRAAEEIGQQRTTAFGFQFAGEGTFVGGDRGAEDETRDDEVLSNLVGIARRGSQELTAFPAECEFCGYRQARWCAGVSNPDVSSWV
jgi:ATP-dependent helicase/nuclease subunit A